MTFDPTHPRGAPLPPLPGHRVSVRKVGTGVSRWWAAWCLTCQVELVDWTSKADADEVALQHQQANQEEE